jgi:hypothetical protein
MSDPRLLAIRDLIQQDPGQRGLRTDPADNLITRTEGDFEAACRSLAETSRPSLAIVTGFYIATVNPPCAETDGPLGAVFLARALMPLGFRILLLTDSFGRKPLDVGLEQCGFNPLQGEVSVLTLVPASHPWEAWMKRDWKPLVGKLGLTHLIALERVGPCRQDGRCYSMGVRDITEHTSPAHLLFEATQQQAFTTIGIGDGGNEIGMGKVPWEVIARNIRNGRQIACRTATDYLIVAGISNWGAYGLAAGVRLLREAPEDPELFDPKREQKLLQAMVKEGPLVDGVSGRPEATVDGLPFDRYAQVLQGIGRIVGSQEGGRR